MRPPSLLPTLGLALGIAGCEAPEPLYPDPEKLKADLLEVVDAVKRDIAHGSCAVEFNKWERRVPDGSGMECSDHEEVHYGGHEHPHFVSCPTGDFSLYDVRPTNPPKELQMEDYPTHYDGFSFHGSTCADNGLRADIFFENTQGLFNFQRGLIRYYCKEKNSGGAECTLDRYPDGYEVLDTNTLSAGELRLQLSELGSLRDDLMTLVREHRNVHECDEAPVWPSNVCY